MSVLGGKLVSQVETSRDFRPSRAMIEAQSSRIPMGSEVNHHVENMTDEMVERDSMEVDVVIVGGGPSGLAAAIRLMQLAGKNDGEFMVVVLEKASEIGAHILSGAVVDPIALNELVPDWKDKGAPLNVPVTDNQHWVLSETGKVEDSAFHDATAAFKRRLLHDQLGKSDSLARRTGRGAGGSSLSWFYRRRGIV